SGPGLALGAALLCALTVTSHGECSLTGLAVARVPPAPAAVLAQADAIRVVALGLVGLVVPALALLAGEGDSDPDVSAGHGETALREGRDWRRAKENPAPARGRARRIARGRSPAGL